MLYIGPARVALQHRHHRAVAQARDDGAARGRSCAQVEDLALVRQGDGGAALADRHGGRFLLRVALHAQVLVLHVAGERAVLHAAPRAAVFKQRDLRAVRHLRENPGCGARLAAQVQAVKRITERNHRHLHVGGRLVSAVRRAVHGGQDRTGHGVLRAHDARVVEVKDLVVCVALAGHLLCAALAHAHAVAKAPCGELEAAARIGDSERLIL